MSIKIDIATFGGKSDHIVVEYSEEGRLALSLPLGTSQASMTTLEARELAAALYGMVHLA